MQITKTLKLFGKEAGIYFFDIDEFNAEILSEDAKKVGDKLHKIFNIYDKNSELSILNQNRGLNVSKELLEVLKKSIEFSKISDGTYDVTFGKNFLLRKKGVVSLPKLNCSYKDVFITGKKVKLLHPDVLIDLGSIAKGYITDKIAEFLINEGVDSFVINSRGDIVVYGITQTIGIAHPRKTDEIIKTISLFNKSVATSGDYNQFSNDFKNSHILNSKDLISVTVVANTLTEAELFSTALFVIEEDKRDKLLSKNTHISVMIIDKDLNIKLINGFDKLINEVVQWK